MRKLVRSTIAIALSLVLAFFSAALTYSAPLPVQGNFSSGAFLLQTTPTPQQQTGKSEIGSTDEIMILGGVIAVIIILPIVLRRKSWMQN